MIASIILFVGNRKDWLGFAMRMRILLEAIVLFLFLQIPGESNEPIVHNFDGARLWKLLDNRGVRVEVGIPIARYREIQKLQAEAMNEKNEILKSVGTKNLRLEIALYSEVDGRTNTAMRELLTPDQIRRLDQITHHVEIAANGIAYAFADGKLSRLIGITENQRTALREKANKYHSSASTHVADLTSQYPQKILDALSEPHIASAKELLGPYFRSHSPTVVLANSHYDDSVEESSDAGKPKPLKAIPDFANRAELFGLLGLPAVQSELGLSIAQRQAIEEAVSKFGKTISKETAEIINGRNLADPSVKEYVTNRAKTMVAKQQIALTPILEELLLPAQTSRLEQMGRWVEIEYVGIAGALVAGRLGKEVGVTDVEKRRVQDRAEKERGLLDLESKRTMSALQEQVIKELSTAQQKNARELLGPFFAYEDWSLTSELRRREQNGDSTP